MPYDILIRVASGSLVSIGPYLLITHPSVPVKAVKELIALAGAEPGKLNYASAGNGAANHLAMELFKSLARLNIAHVPYKGAPQAVTDLIAANVNLMFNSIPPVLQYIRSGRLKLLGVSSAKRSSQLPEVPTIREAGVPGYESITWFGLLAPAKTPGPIVVRLNDAMAKVVHAPDIKSQLESQGYEVGGASPGEFARPPRPCADRRWNNKTRVPRRLGPETRAPRTGHGCASRCNGAAPAGPPHSRVPNGNRD